MGWAVPPCAAARSHLSQLFCSMAPSAPAQGGQKQGSPTLSHDRDPLTIGSPQGQELARGDTATPQHEMAPLAPRTHTS